MCFRFVFFNFHCYKRKSYLRNYQYTIPIPRIYYYSAKKHPQLLILTNSIDFYLKFMKS